jgi:hypothetical protein
MPRSILAALFLESASKMTRKLWLAAIVLSPMAMVAGIWVIIRYQPSPPIEVTLDREKAIRLARQFAAAKGVDVSRWKATVSKNADQNSLLFLNRRADRRELWQIDPPLSARVILRAPDRRQSATILVTLDGHVFGYDFTGLPRSQAVPVEIALRMAKAELPQRLAFGDPGITNTDAGHEFSFHAAPLSGFEITATVRVEGDRATALKLEGVLESGAGSGSSDEDPVTIAAIIFAFVMGAFSLFRYAVRSMQGEVSHARSLLVAALCGAFALLIETDVIQGSSDAPAFVVGLVLLLISLLAGGMLAIAYGSGEGDLREAYPGKLTSLDALLTGHVYSWNVGVSMLFGFVSGAWCILGAGMVAVLFGRGEEMGASGAFFAPLIRFPLLLGAVTWLLLALTYAAAGLLQPLALLQQYGKRLRRWWIPVTILCAALVSALRTTHHPGAERMGFAAVATAALLGPFFALDLLASLVCVTLLVAAVEIAPSVVVIPHQNHAVASAAIAFGVIVFAALAIRYGKTVTPEQVRPLYARHIAERKALEAEVSAAREAQLRLLPAAAPYWQGLSISAACVPAEIVGGDFYDFFKLGDGRLGIFMAEGNNRGLAAALKIALAKGYLMQAVEKTRDPVEILARLEAALGAMPGASADARTGFAFVTIDSRDGALQYARTGAYPRIVISSARTVLSETLAPIRGRALPLLQGSAAMAAGDRVLLFTDGIGRKLSANGDAEADSTLAKMAAEHQDAERLSRRVLAASRYDEAPDDLTIVVIRVESVGQSALEVVA